MYVVIILFFFLVDVLTFERLKAISDNVVKHKPQRDLRSLAKELGKSEEVKLHLSLRLRYSVAHELRFVRKRDIAFYSFMCLYCCTNKSNYYTALAS